jgi:hypothetical protein
LGLEPLTLFVKLDNLLIPPDAFVKIVANLDMAAKSEQYGKFTAQLRVHRTYLAKFVAHLQLSPKSSRKFCKINVLLMFL